MLNIAHKNTFYFLRYAHVRYVKIVFTNILKQYNMLKVSLHFKSLQTSLANNLRFYRIKNAKFSGSCFCLNINIYGNFQVCITVSLNKHIIKKIMNGLIFFGSNDF